MVRELVHDPIFLAQKSIPATKEDLQTAQDLLDTLEAHRETCVGMAANMIGVCKRVIVFDHEGTYMVMLNPQIVKQSDAYETEEGCLSLEGLRPTVRYKEITVEYDTTSFEHKTEKFTGWVAQIIQHECDHLKGIII